MLRINDLCVRLYVTAMWRKSLYSSFSSRIFSSSSWSNPNYTSFSSSPSFSSSLFTVDGVVRSPLYLSHGFSSSSPSSESATKLAFVRSDGIRAFGSSAAGAVDVSSKARVVAELARHYGRCYWELSKARLSMLVVATSGTGYVLGSGNALDFAGLCWTCAGTMMVAASANTMNQVFEVDNDAKMKRTMRRPLPSGRITVRHAVTWASFTGCAGTALLASKANMLAAGLGASNLILYAFIYTPLKQIHPINTWVGAVVGAIPPLLGWVAASGHVCLTGMILPAALYFWQIPHFMALAYLCRSDYAAGGFKMFSLTDASGQRTAAVALRNCLYLVPLGFFASDWGVASGWFCLESTLLTLAISAAAFSFYRDRTTKKARRMFHASLLYLPVFMSGLLFHRLSDNHQCHSQMIPDNILELYSSPETAAQESGDFHVKNKGRRMGTQSRPPVSYASVAPFPFLPVPSYAAA